jgi:NAD(P)H-dependent FMN reductase
VRIGLLCGSLSPDSANGAALAVVGAVVAEHGGEAVTVQGLASIPPFAFDPLNAPPLPVAELQACLAGVDAMVIAAPE